MDFYKNSSSLHWLQGRLENVFGKNGFPPQQADGQKEKKLRTLQDKKRGTKLDKIEKHITDMTSAVKAIQVSFNLFEQL